MKLLTKLNGHNPNSKSHKAREAKKKLLQCGVVKCCKCKAGNVTLLKRNVGGKEQYICKSCYEKTPEGKVGLLRKV